MKKTGIIILFAALFLFSSACSAEKENLLTSDEFNNLFELIKLSGADEISFQRINADESYKIFLDENEYAELVDESETIYESYGNEGYEVLLILSKANKRRQVFDLLSKRYEWAPCDPAEKIIFAEAGGVVLAVKGSIDNTEKIYKAFCSFFGGKCRTVSKERNYDNLIET